jgi:putative membrane protein
LDGEAFDRAFAQRMVADHKKAVSKFETAKLMAMNSELRAFIDSTLPTLKEHLDHARELK